MTDRLYLDANASEPLRPEARNAVLSALDVLGNPSSVHAAGRAARRLLEAARARIGAVLDARPADIILTGGATEANAMALHGLGRNRRIIVGATEHPSVLSASPSAVRAPVRSDGQIDLEVLERLLADGVPSLLCLMAANNETGVMHPLEDASRLCRRNGALLHVDAVQIPGRERITLTGSGADCLSLSAHKVGGPKGAGALVLRPNLALDPMITGGGQERGRRGGTEPLPAIAGFAAALVAADGDDMGRIASLRDRLELLAGSHVVAKGSKRLPNTTCLLLPGVRAETQVIALDLEGIEVSAGSACSSGKVTASPVLQAMGLGADASCAIRVSLPWNTPDNAPERFGLAYGAIRKRLDARATLSP